MEGCVCGCDFFQAECHSCPTFTPQGRNDKEKVLLLSDKSLIVLNSLYWPEKSLLWIPPVTPHLDNFSALGPTFLIVTTIFL